MLRTSDFDYDLPSELIAQTPLADRSASRLLVLDKQTGEIQHRQFADILEYLNEGDCLVLNNTRVIPARLIGKKTTGGAVEILLLKRRDGNIWECIGKGLSLGAEVFFGTQVCFAHTQTLRAQINADFKNNVLKAKVVEILDNGNRLVEFFYDGIWEEILDRLGQMPLPPYIKEKLQDRERYQTVYSREEGSAAAPTAGLHWTPQLLDKMREKGVNIAELTLHVGLGTFRPIADEDFEKHQMHSEWFSIDEKNTEIINDTKGKIIACGTTTVRVLETIADERGNIKACSGETNIFIAPPYNFKIVDNLITNFHLPRSTLMMLVSALAGCENILNAYNEAIKEKYRFFSFGDCMLIM